MNTIGTWTARAASVTTLSAAAVLGFAGLAHADNIQDTIADNGTGVALVAGSSTAGTAAISLIGNNSGQDPDPGCNIDPGESPLKLDIITPAGVTANPDPLSITSCGTDFEVSFTASSTAVSGTVTVSVISGPSGNGTYMNQVSIPITVTQPSAPPTADTTKPTITHKLTPRAANVNGWFNENVGVAFTCTDEGGSEIDSCTGDTTLTEGEHQSVTGTATDKAGNTATDTVSGINIDTTDPSVAFRGGPEADAEYYYGSVPAAPACDASDALSGLDGPCAVNGGGTAVGTHTYTATATDRAGNTTTRPLSYTVMAWTLKGFTAPVDMNGVWNTVKGGSTVPLKFEVFAGTTEKTDTAVVKSFTTKAVTCPGSAAPVDEIELTTTGGTALRYDTTGGQFIQNWQTPKKPGTCAQTTVTTQDGSTITANFMFK